MIDAVGSGGLDLAIYVALKQAMGGKDVQAAIALEMMKESLEASEHIIDVLV